MKQKLVGYGKESEILEVKGVIVEMKNSTDRIYLDGPHWRQNQLADITENVAQK